MDASFSVAAEPERDLIKMTLSGFFTPETMAAFIRARNAAHAQLRCGANEHVTLADIRAIAIQSKDLVDQFQAILADPRYRSRRLAMVTPSSLARLQAYRAAGNRDARFFADPVEARAWLLERDSQSRAA